MKPKELTVILSAQQHLRDTAAKQYKELYPRAKVYQFPHQKQVDPHEPFLYALDDFLGSKRSKGLWVDSWLTLAVDLSLRHRVASDYVGHTQVLTRLQDVIDAGQLKLFFWLLPATDDYSQLYSDYSPWWRESMIQSEKRYEWAWLSYVNEQIPFLGEILNPEFIQELPSK